MILTLEQVFRVDCGSPGAPTDDRIRKQSGRVLTRDSEKTTAREKRNYQEKLSQVAVNDLQTICESVKP